MSSEACTQLALEVPSKSGANPPVHAAWRENYDRYPDLEFLFEENLLKGRSKPSRLLPSELQLGRCNGRRGRAEAGAALPFTCAADSIEDCP
ncbi:hypothetical protein EVAR_51088_1 [Eumeta japonica]|uniref:Uncharacterized protein n=1 Tax=Eumeta variegata TaxID=151549 RepID=A0A4C1XKW5_EUMVA|nr:hypothetical protein EVAR_51088_1 [Eumeta japonica]